jgi:hypothetical protein
MVFRYNRMRSENGRLATERHLREHGCGGIKDYAGTFPMTPCAVTVLRAR